MAETVEPASSSADLVHQKTAGPSTAASRPTPRWRWFLGLGILVTLIGFVGPRRLIETFARIDPGLALAVLGLSLVWLGIAGLNVWILLRRLCPIPLLRFLPVYGTSWAVAQLLPGQLGDASQVVLLRRYGVPASQSGAAYLVDKAMSLAWLALVALYGIGRYAPSFSDRLAVQLVSVLAGGVALVGLATLVALRLPAREGGRVARLKNLLRNILSELARMRRQPGALALNAALTLLKWLVMAMMYIGTFLAFDRALGFEAAATIPVMSSLVGYLPVTVGGAGTMEVTGVFLFGRLGIDAATVLTVFLFLRIELLAIALGLALFRSTGTQSVVGEGSS